MRLLLVGSDVHTQHRRQLGTPLVSQAVAYRRRKQCYFVWLHPGGAMRKSSILLTARGSRRRSGCYSLNTLDDESSVSTGFRSPWKPNRRPRAARSGRLYIGFRGDLNSRRHLDSSSNHRLMRLRNRDWKQVT